MKRKVIIACLIAAMTLGVFSGCGKKITEQSTFGNTPVNSETSETTTETTKEIHYEYVGETAKYISTLHNNFPMPGAPISESYSRLVATLDNQDCAWSTKDNTICYSFITKDATKAIVDRFEYSGYEIGKDESDPKIEQKEKTLVGSIYIKCFSKEEATELYNQACSRVKDSYSGEEDVTDTSTGKTFITYKDSKENWLSKVELFNPSGEESYYILCISISR